MCFFDDTCCVRCVYFVPTPIWCGVKRGRGESWHHIHSITNPGCACTLCLMRWGPRPGSWMMFEFAKHVTLLREYVCTEALYYVCVCICLRSKVAENNAKFMLIIAWLPFRSKLGRNLSQNAIHIQVVSCLYKPCNNAKVFS